MPNYIEAAKIEIMLWREFLATPDVRPATEDCIWIEDIACGPRPQGLERLQAVQDHFGFSHVTTGNASVVGKPVRIPLCGVYVRESAYADAPNWLRSYLSTD